MSSSAHELQPPSEAALIRIARQARGLSPEAAAELLPFKLSGVRWRQIEKGYERKNPPKLVSAPARTLAHMAHVLGLSPERLEKAGRADAAEILREIGRAEAEAPSDTPLSPDGEMVRRVVLATAREWGLKAQEMDEVLRLVRQDLERMQRSGNETEDPGNSRAG